MLASWLQNIVSSISCASARPSAATVVPWMVAATSAVSSDSIASPPSSSQSISGWCAVLSGPGSSSSSSSSLELSAKTLRVGLRRADSLGAASAIASRLFNSAASSSPGSGLILLAGAARENTMNSNRLLAQRLTWGGISQHVIFIGGGIKRPGHQAVLPQDCFQQAPEAGVAAESGYVSLHPNRLAATGRLSRGCGGCSRVPLLRHIA